METIISYCKVPNAGACLWGPGGTIYELIDDRVGIWLNRLGRGFQLSSNAWFWAAQLVSLGLVSEATRHQGLGMEPPHGHY